MVCVSVCVCVGDEGVSPHSMIFLLKNPHRAPSTPYLKVNSPSRKFRQ